ncbi:chromate efflux transporter [Lysobacter soyae]|uniref:Chromate efflux transporter n=1 Tax=Lysobacter soyae TaxID=2764185 RepID=A0ABX8WRZ9_9GAMM|nr:chromate efflux transporter [Lysobacter sp. CJ11]QYR53602.1 chromate efflux transporter [Lysobacter sp. CJ11]
MSDQRVFEGAPGAPSSVPEIFLAFLKLGLSAFGGPIAHVGYMHNEFVVRRRWLDEPTFAQVLALCQFLPGPASSQLGFSLGLMRGGSLGAIAAFVAFTLPSVLLMFGMVAALPHLDTAVAAALIHGLKLVAVVVVAHGLIGMARQLTPDIPRAVIAVCAALAILATQSAWMQLLTIVFGAMAGRVFCRHVAPKASSAIPLRFGARWAPVFMLLYLIGLGTALYLGRHALPTSTGIAAAFYQAGALVFGGGHVVLPLLQSATVDTGWLTPQTFLAGYGAAQAMPGPMFSLAAFLGAEANVGQPWLGGLVAVLAIFLPGFLLLMATLPVWARVANHPRAVHAMAGINAAVVGVLAAAFVTPVCTQGLHSLWDGMFAVIACVAMLGYRVPAIWIVGACLVYASAAAWS